MPSFGYFFRVCFFISSALFERATLASQSATYFFMKAIEAGLRTLGSGVPIVVASTEGSEERIAQLKGMGASNENIARLQGNLDLISGRGGQQDATAQRRIREQAKRERPKVLVGGASAYPRHWDYAAIKCM